MSKRFKLKFPSINLSIPSFQFCRLKSPNSFPKIPKPANYRRSPVNPKAFDISFPSVLPATPEYTYVSRRASSKSTRKMRSSSSSSSSSNGGDRLCRSKPCSDPRCSEHARRRSVETTSLEKRFVNKKTTKTRSSHRIRSDLDEDGDDDSLILLDSSRSFSSEQYPTTEILRRRRRWSPPKTAEERKAIGEMVTAAAARESVAVVKKTEDPYDEFKRSMLEMIMEKEMFEATDLEELLQCFLTLNSRQYHGIIVEAFSEIWEILFSDNHHDSHAKHPLSF